MMYKPERALGHPVPVTGKKNEKTKNYKRKINSGKYFHNTLCLREAKGMNIKMKEKENAFSGLRLIACFCVFALHCYSGKMSLFAAWAVSLFFMMSGFLYGKRYAKRPLPIRNTFSFVWRKLKKLYPLYLFTTVLAIPFFVITVGWEQILHQLFPYLLLLQGVLYPYSEALLAAAWFISVIVILYLLTPLLVNFAKKLDDTIGRKGIVAFCLGCIVLLGIYSKYMYESGAASFWIYSFALVRIPEYTIAICLGLAAGKQVNSGRKNRKQQELLADGVILAVFLFVVVCGFSNKISQAFWRDVLWIMPNGLLLYFADKNIGLMAKILSWKLFVSLGQMSFEIYLFHPVFLLYSTFWNEFWDSKRIWRICCFCLILCLTLLASYLWKRVQKI